MLECEERSGPTESRLYLVDGEQRPVAATQLLRAFEVALRREEHAVSLDRLDDEERDVLAPELLLERVEIGERDMIESGDQWAEPLREVPVAGSG